MYKNIVLLLSIIVMSLLITSCNEKEKSQVFEPQKSPTSIEKHEEQKESDKGFNFILNYGNHGKNILNTYEGTFTKDLVSAGTITTKLELSEDEKKVILNEMLELNIFNYPNNFKEYLSMTPRSDYRLEINYEGKKKILNWSGNNIPLKSINPNEKDPQKAVEYTETDETKSILDLGRLEQKIEKIIESKLEYKKLPKALGGYL